MLRSTDALGVRTQLVEGLACVEVARGDCTVPSGTEDGADQGSWMCRVKSLPNPGSPRRIEGVVAYVVVRFVQSHMIEEAKEPR